MVQMEQMKIAIVAAGQKRKTMTTTTILMMKPMILN